MLTLVLLRHAKSSWADPGQRDFDRPLNDRGRKAAPTAGKALHDLGFHPDLVACSASRRTRATLDLVLPQLKGPAPATEFNEALYHASIEGLLSYLHAIKDGPRNVLLVGHNPGLHGLALTLYGSGTHETLVLLRNHFPTAAFACFTFAGTSWKDIGTGNGHMTAFVTPKRN